MELVEQATAFRSSSVATISTDLTTRIVRRAYDFRCQRESRVSNRASTMMSEKAVACSTNSIEERENNEDRYKAIPGTPRREVNLRKWQTIGKPICDSKETIKICYRITLSS